MTGWRIERHGTLNSTSDVCVARAKDGEPAGLAVVTAQQTGGRGRGGRAWVSPPDNLYCSVLLRPSMAAGTSGLWSLLAGLVLLESVQEFLPPAVRASLKWPNDVLIDGAKLGGVLIDAAIEQTHVSWLVIGFGANIAHAPQLAGRAVTCLAAHGGIATPEAVIDTLLTRLDHWCPVVESGGDALLREAWLARAHPQGSPISVDAGRISGTFAGLTADGALLLARDGHIETIRTGEIAAG